MLSADEYHAIFEASPDGCLVVDADGVIRDLNPQVEILFGWSREDLIGQPVEMLVPEAQRPGHGHHRSGYVGDPHVRPMGAGLELSGLRRDGSRFPAEISLSPWLSADGDKRVICSVRDVSERKRLQDFSEGMLRATEDERLRIRSGIARRHCAALYRAHGGAVRSGCASAALHLFPYPTSRKLDATTQL